MKVAYASKRSVAEMVLLCWENDWCAFVHTLTSKDFLQVSCSDSSSRNYNVGIQLLSVSTVCNQFTIASCKIGKHVGYEVSA